jgi:transposase
VIAPSQIPRRAGERIKTDRRDCLRLAECSPAGELRAVWVPDLEDEAIRDLARAREDAVHSRTQARQQLKGFLLRHDVRYPGKTSWTKSFHVWLGTLNFGPAGAQTAFTEYQLAVQSRRPKGRATDPRTGTVDPRLALRTGCRQPAGAA